MWYLPELPLSFDTVHKALHDLQNLSLMLMKELAQQFGPNEGKTLFLEILHRFSSSLSFTTCGKREVKTRLSSNAERETFVAAITVLFA